MAPVNEEQQKVKANRAFWTGAVCALLFAFSVGFPSGFGWITFAASFYSFFLYWYWQPRAPRPASSFRQPFNQSRSGSPVHGGDIVKRIVRFIALGIFGLVALLFVIGIFSEDTSTVEDSSYDDEQFTETSEETSATTEDWVAVGNEYYNQQQYDSADYYYDRALAGDPSNSAAVYNKGLIQYERQNFESARDLFEQSYSLGMRTGFLCTELAQRYAERGQTDQAVAMYKEAAAQDSTLVNVYTRLAELDPANATVYRALEVKWATSPN